MSQHSQFEETLHDSPQPAPSYEDGYNGPQPETYLASVPAQKLQMPDMPRGSNFGVGARLVLALVSLGMVFTMSLVTLLITSSTRAIIFSVVFAGAVVIINISFNRKH